MIPNGWQKLREPCDVPGCDRIARKGRRFCDAHERPNSRVVHLCQGCLTRLREPARLCGFCIVELQEAA